MNPRLYVIKAKTARNYRTRHFIRFAVVDRDRKSSYPSNFICMLPQRVTTTAHDESVFAKIFRENRVETARALLTSALRSENDLEIKTEIRQRLRLLENKGSNKHEN